MLIVEQGIIHYMPIYAKYIRQFLLSSIEDGISYVEPRFNFWYKYDVVLEPQIFSDQRQPGT